jgi:hypothetical protein
MKKVFFAGLEGHLFLIKEKDSNEICKVSKRRVKTMEREFCRSRGSAAKANLCSSTHLNHVLSRLFSLLARKGVEGTVGD